MNTRLIAVLILSLSVFGSRMGAAQDASTVSSGASRFPSEVVAFGSIHDVDAIVDTILEHPLREEIEELDVYKALTNSKEYLQFQAGLRLFEAGMGSRWKTTLKKATKHGVFVAADPRNNGAALLLHAESGEILDDLREWVFSYVEGASDDPIKSSTYEGVAVYAIGSDAYVADLDDWLLLTNNKELGKEVLDLHLGQGDEKTSTANSLAASPNFQDSLKLRGGDEAAFAFFNIQTIRDSGAVEELYSGKTDNILAEALLGGIAANLQYADFSALCVQLDENKLKVTAKTPHKPEWIDENREYFFGAGGSGKAKKLIHSTDQVLGLTFYRDLSQMWLRAGDLMKENAVEELAKADSQLSLFFSGKDFGEDILASFEPEAQLIVSKQKFGDKLPMPAIKLPSFAFKFKMKDAETATKELRRIFHSFVGFLNIVGAMEGQPQLDFDWDRGPKREVLSASYVPNVDEEDWESAPINFNFAPALVFDGEDLILASTRQLASELLEGELESESSPHNTYAQLEPQVLRSILEDNREQLVAQTMLDDGKSREEATRDIDVIMTLVGMLENASLSLDHGEDNLGISLTLDIRTEVDTNVNGSE